MVNVSVFEGSDGIWRRADLEDLNEHLAWEAVC